MFKEGNQYGTLTKRGLNKTTKETKDLINRILFNEQEFIADWQQMDVRERMEIRIKMAKFIVPEPKEIVSDQKDLPLFIDTRDEAINIMQQLDLSEEQLIEQTND